jgi:hypothetical protein
MTVIQLMSAQVKWKHQVIAAGHWGLHPLP